jgi:ribonuclease P protein component
LTRSYTFTVHERLKREQHIKTLFHKGKAFSAFPLKCIWLPLHRNEERSPVRIVISVPKKRTPLATDRNRVKRLLREAWRLNKHLLYEQVPAAVQLHLFLVYTGQPNPDLPAMEKAVQQMIRLLAPQIPATNA